MYEDNNTNPSPESTDSSASYTSPPPSAPDPGYSPEIRKPKKGMTAGRIIALALVCSLLGGCLGAGTVLLASRGAKAESAEPAEPVSETVILEGARETADVNTAAVDTSRLLTPSQVYAENVASTVGITTSVTTNYWGYQSTYPASGSGFILSKDGYILTNYHVIDDSSSVSVTTYDNKTYEAEIIGYDVSNDIAVLKIQAEDLTPVVLGDSATLSVGDTVVAIGNPLGELTFSLTQGVVSALDREITMSSGSTMTLIQTDAAINNGNSGGALFNMYGEVVGITNAKYSSSGSSASIDNIGFAIPINRVRSVVESIIEHGYIVRPYIGVSVATVTAELQSYGIPQGAAVREINEDSPAQAAGLEINDVITAVDETPIASSSDLVNVISQSKPGDELTLTVYRHSEGGEVTIVITVGEKQQDAKPAEKNDQATQPQTGDMSPYFSFPFGFGGWG